MGQNLVGSLASYICRSTSCELVHFELGGMALRRGVLRCTELSGRGPFLSASFAGQSGSTGKPEPGSLNGEKDWNSELASDSEEVCAEELKQNCAWALALHLDTPWRRLSRLSARRLRLWSTNKARRFGTEIQKGRK